MCHSEIELIKTIFSASVSFSAVLIVVVTFMLMMYDTKRDVPSLARPYRQASLVITFFVFLPNLIVALLSFFMVACPLDLAIYNMLLRIIIFLFSISLILTLFGLLYMVKIVLKKVFR